MNITTGKITGTAKRVVIYGPEGVGKSTLANSIPGSVFIDTEDGTKELDVNGRILAPDWRAIEAAVRELTANPQGFTAVIIDTADWCEKAMIENMLQRSGKKSIEDYGYGKGYKAAEEEFARFLGTLDGLIAKGVHVVFVAHSTVKRLSPPDQTDGYDRYELKLTKAVAPLVKEWADMILFCKFEVQIVEGSDGKLKAQGGKKRVIYTTHSPAWDAKNRFGLADELPMTFASIASVFDGNAPRPATIEPAKQAVTPPPAKVPAPAKPAPVTTEADQIPGLDDPVVEVPAKIAAWLDANADAVNAYAVRANWLPAGKGWRLLPADKLTMLVTRSDQFARAAKIATTP